MRTTSTHSVTGSNGTRSVECSGRRTLFLHEHPRERSERGSLRRSAAEAEVVFPLVFATEETRVSKKRYGLAGTERRRRRREGRQVHDRLTERSEGGRKWTRRDLNPMARRSCSSLRSCAGCDSRDSNPGSNNQNCRRSRCCERQQLWTRRDLNPGPLPCEGSDLPLIYEPTWSRTERGDIPSARESRDARRDRGPAERAAARSRPRRNASGFAASVQSSSTISILTSLGT